MAADVGVRQLEGDVVARALVDVKRGLRIHHVKGLAWCLPVGGLFLTRQNV